jgi:hypothetical protein
MYLVKIYKINFVSIILLFEVRKYSIFIYKIYFTCIYGCFSVRPRRPQHMQSVLTFWIFIHVVIISLPPPSSHFSYIPISVFKYQKTNFQTINQSIFNLTSPSSSKFKMPQIFHSSN